MRGGILVLALAAPAVARAAGGEAAAHGPNWGMFVAAVFNLAVLAAILVRFARQPVRNFLIQRSRRIARAIEDAERRLEEADSEVTSWRDRLARVGQETEELIRLAGEATDAERQRRLRRASATAERIRTEASGVAEQELGRAREELRAEVADLSAGIAASLVREGLRPEDDRRLVAECVDRLEGGAA